MIWPFKSKNDQLKQLVMTEQTVVVPVKAAYYHEIVGDCVRIYSRTEGLVEEKTGCADPKAEALAMMAKWGAQ